MPFNPPFKNKYIDGDLLYGLRPVRNCYIEKHAVFKRINKQGPIIAMIDDYAVTEIQRANQESRTVPVPKNQDDFIHFLQNHPKYKSAYNGESFKVQHKDSYIVFNNPVEIVRKCKAGLYWATKKQNFQIHFLLDEINFAEVISKSNVQDHSYNTVKDYMRKQTERMQGATLYSHYPDHSLKGRSITGSELRWIYRNRADKKVQRIIQFWYKYKPCCPPWEPAFDSIYGSPTAHLWLGYVPKNKQALLASADRCDKFPSLAALLSCIRN